MSLLFWRVEHARRALVAAEDETLRRSEERFRSLVGNASDVMAILDADGVVRYQRPAAERVWGYPEDGLVGRSIGELHHPDDALTVLGLVIHALDTPQANVAADLRLQLSDGSWRDSEVIANNLLADPRCQGDGGDVPRRHRAEGLRAAVHRPGVSRPADGLPNRALFMDRLERALARAAAIRRHHRRDLRRPGQFQARQRQPRPRDAATRCWSPSRRRLQEGCAVSDSVARLGGDEFTILIEDVDGEERRSARASVCGGLQAPLTSTAASLRPSASVAWRSSRPGHAPRSLLRHADLAMYEAKATGKATVRVLRCQDA